MPAQNAPADHEATPPSAKKAKKLNPNSTNEDSSEESAEKKLASLLQRRTALLRLSEPYQPMIDGFKTTQEDVVMITPPKCGAHNGWVAQILHQIRMGADGDEDFDDLLAQVPQLHCLVLMSGYPIGCAQNGPTAPLSTRLFRSHEAIPLRLGEGNQGKIIFVSGDPLDTFYCWQKYMELQTGVYNVPQTGFLENVHKTLHTPGLPAKMADDYWAQIGYAWELYQKKDPRFLWIHFRDLVSQLDACVEKIAAFMGRPCDDAPKATVREYSSREYMTRNTSKFNFAALRNKRLRLIGVNPNTAGPPAGYKSVNELAIGAGAGLVDPQVAVKLAQIWKERVEDEIGVKDYEELYAKTSFCG